MTRPLTIVVTCTNRKRLAPAEPLRIRNLTGGTMPQRSAEWARRMARTDDQRLPLNELYMGESWTQVQALLSTARGIGYSPSAYVASAGLGLRPIDSSAQSYAATFAAGHEDSVTATSAQTHLWWASLRKMPGARILTDAASAQTLLVLSESYAKALRDDLVSLGSTGKQSLLFGGWMDVPGLTRIPADRGLSLSLGGSATSLTLRMAVAWLERGSGTELYSPQVREKWDTWAKEAPRAEMPTREKASDEDVMSFVSKQLQTEPSLAYTPALERWRASGRKCEQGRFKKLFHETKGATL